ncbi:hypothetical protein K1719_014043 [Acacia pycnantha]|nr:hypothetical protein K1719_014043 [Acacia pycnantha]
MRFKRQQGLGRAAPKRKGQGNWKFGPGRAYEKMKTSSHYPTRARQNADTRAFVFLFHSTFNLRRFGIRIHPFTQRRLRRSQLRSLSAFTFTPPLNCSWQSAAFLPPFSSFVRF